MIACEGQKAECYQSGACGFCKSIEIVECGMLIEMFGEPNTWAENIMIWLIFFGVGVFLMWVGFLAAKIF